VADEWGFDDAEPVHKLVDQIDKVIDLKVVVLFITSRFTESPEINGVGAEFFA